MPDAPPARPRLATPALAAIGAAIFVVAFFVGRATPHGDATKPDSVVVRPSPNVITAVRDLARLESVEYHVERVIELSDEQERVFGLVHAKDTLLLVAAGDVVAGVDLAKLGDGDVRAEPDARRVRVHLPAPEVFSVAIDNARTHVVTRDTDVLATRQEALEGRARAEAESSMRKAALDAGVLDRAKGSAERAVRELLTGLGYEDVAFD